MIPNYISYQNKRKKMPEPKSYEFQSPFKTDYNNPQIAMNPKIADYKYDSPYAIGYSDPPQPQYNNLYKDNRRTSNDYKLSQPYGTENTPRTQSLFQNGNITEISYEQRETLKQKDPSLINKWNKSHIFEPEVQQTQQTINQPNLQSKYEGYLNSQRLQPSVMSNSKYEEYLRNSPRKSDPDVQPTKQIANLAEYDEKQHSYGAQGMVPQPRYDTTYRREFLNFKNGLAHQSNDPAALAAYNKNYNNPQEQSNSSLNPFALLPPIDNSKPSTERTNMNNYGNQQQVQQQQQMQQQQIQQQRQQQNSNAVNSEYLPAEPISLSPQEEQALISDVQREFSNMNQNVINSFYAEVKQYDQQGTGFVHYQYVNMAAMKSNFTINESLFRFIMSKFVSPSKERGYVNYEELVKFLNRCTIPTQSNPPTGYQQYNPVPEKYGIQPPEIGPDGLIKYDPDEQAILRLMHENMRDWDQINLIDCDNLRKKFYEMDTNQSYVLSQSEIEDVCYRNRVPIQRSLTFQILEKYCKVATNHYKWPAFVDFLDKLHNLRLPNKKKTDYTIRSDEKDNYSEKFTYRIAQLDSLRSKANEEERIQEINKQIVNLQNMKAANQERVGTAIGNYIKGESWFTRFMRLANAIYSHRIANGATFTLPKDEARSMIKAYNTVYELGMDHTVIEDALSRTLHRETVVIDDLLKVLSRLNLSAN